MRRRVNNAVTTVDLADVADIFTGASLIRRPSTNSSVTEVEQLWGVPLRGDEEYAGVVAGQVEGVVEAARSTSGRQTCTAGVPVRRCSRTHQQ